VSNSSDISSLINKRQKQVLTIHVRVMDPLAPRAQTATSSSRGAHPISDVATAFSLTMGEHDAPSRNKPCTSTEAPRNESQMVGNLRLDGMPRPTHKDYLGSLITHAQAIERIVTTQYNA
jgi:hypothetical protein